jgi:hypothetical protein
MISLQKTNFVTFKKPNLRKPTKTYAKYTKYDDVKKDEEDVLICIQRSRIYRKD